MWGGAAGRAATHSRCRAAWRRARRPARTAPTPVALDLRHDTRCSDTSPCPREHSAASVPTLRASVGFRHVTTVFTVGLLQMQKTVDVTVRLRFNILHKSHNYISYVKYLEECKEKSWGIFKR